MFKLAKPVFLMCETALHAGSGSELGVVDLPIQRERHTDFPKIESSSLKGGIREAFEEPTKNTPFLVGKEPVTPTSKAKTPESDCYQLLLQLAFGPEKADYSGALGFTDARLLLFPVKSMKGVFAWVTCPKVLQQFRNDLALCNLTLSCDLPGEHTAPQGCQLFVQGNNVVLEEYTFAVTADTEEQGTCTQFADWLSTHLFPSADAVYAYWREKIKTDVVVLSNDEFRDFVTLATEVITRTKISPTTGTVEKGALFTEEYLPAESMLYSLALTSPIFRKDDAEKGIFKQNGATEESLVMQFLQRGLPNVIQLGGNATIGKGIVRTQVMEG